MSSQLRACARLGVCTLVMASSLVFGQTSFTPLGNEYRIGGALPGDQAFPQAAITLNGGWVVWQDNFTDEDGSGISAQKINSTLSGSFGKIRINQNGFGDQENPQIAALADGGTVFVWQGGSATNKDIYARFMNSSGLFITGDVLVNTFIKGNQVNPKVSVLSSGDVVVVWSSFGQDATDDLTFQGVYGQRLSSAGQKIGSEFHVNQTTIYNQRDPSVAALAGGGYVVCWINDSIPTTSYNNQGFITNIADNVHLYARTFDVSGNPAGNEFRVDTGSFLCANPAVSAQEDGGYMIVWGQKDKASTVVSGTGWDIFFRSYNASNQAVTDVTRLNTTIFGDQYIPVIINVGSDHLVVWTSLGQDGSGTGVYGQFVSGAGQLIGSEFRVNSTTQNNQQQPALATDGVGTILAVWSGIVQGSGFDVFAQRYSVTRAVPTPPQPFVVASGSTALNIIWPPLQGFVVSGYELYVDGNSVSVFTLDSSYMLTGLDPASTHTFQLVYDLADGRRSTKSPVATGKTWGVDANGDGLPDDWQTLYFGINPAKWPSPNVDSDGDGATDWEEFLAGTNPKDPNSVLRTTMQVVNDRLQFQWTTTAGLVYQVQFSLDLVNWGNLGAPRLASGTQDSINIDTATGVGYYRVILLR